MWRLVVRCLKIACPHFSMGVVRCGSETMIDWSKTRRNSVTQCWNPQSTFVQIVDNQFCKPGHLFLTNRTVADTYSLNWQIFGHFKHPFSAENLCKERFLMSQCASFHSVCYCCRLTQRLNLNIAVIDELAAKLDVPFWRATRMWSREGLRWATQ